MNYGLGIDTGGTYTDSVILDITSGKVISRSKALTTRDDLSIGIGNSLAQLDKSILKTVSLVSLSSTLATNSVVEGKGGRVGLLCIGKQYSSPEEADYYAFVRGSFTMAGVESEPLDTNSLRSQLESMKGKVDAIAIAGYLGVRNPSHEEHASDMAKDILRVPVVCAHELTSKLGFEQRATTAMMNARLMPVISELLDAVRRCLLSLNINAPLMIVKGNGAVISEEVARIRPVETVLSGPASSLTGAKALTGLENAIMMDMGGTTTDIGILRDGFPRIDAEGAHIDGKPTRVQAADISTYGIGGDSRIIINGGKVQLCQVRVIPLCIATKRWPAILDKLKTLEDVTERRSAEICAEPKIIQNTEFFTSAHTVNISEMSEVDSAFLALAREHPTRVADAAEILGVSQHSIGVARMEELGMLTRIGVTPTDILHAEGTYTEYCAQASTIAVKFMARGCKTDFETFISDVKKQIVCKIGRSLMDDLLGENKPNRETSDSDKEFIERIMNKESEEYGFSFTVNMPIIGIGAPVRAWLTPVAEMFGTKLILPENWDVGNAIGAITGSIRETATVEVRSLSTDLQEKPRCKVFFRSGSEEFDDPDSAIEFAKQKAMEISEEDASASKAREMSTSVEITPNTVEMSGKTFFKGASVVSTTTGKPNILERL